MDGFGRMVNRITQRGPSVYETEGPRGLAARTAACAATLRRGATTSARNPPEAPTARLSPRSGISPGWSPVYGGLPPVPETHPKYRSPGSSSVPEFPPVGPRFQRPAAGAADPPEVPVTQFF
jgi:hypothetical protein